MIITKTPLRVSLLGGGTDLPAYATQHGGACLSMAIDKYIHVIVKPRFDDKIFVSYSQTELVNEVDDIKHDLIRECLKFTRITSGIEIITVGDIPGNGSGLGSSGAVTVGVLHALYAYQGELVTKPQLAGRATEIEAMRLLRPIGLQDQTASTYGGFNLYEFWYNGNIAINQVGPKNIIDKLMLFYTGQARISSPILQKQKERIPQNIDNLHKIKELALEGFSDPSNIGVLLNDYWKLKKKISPNASNSHIHKMYTLAMGAGATGAKICGAGGGGYFLVWAEPDKQTAVRDALKDYNELIFGLDSKGTRVVYNA